MNSQISAIDFDNSVEFALALLAEADTSERETRPCARPPCELLDADGWPGDGLQFDDAA
jgi:hypothetical protein